MVRENQSREGGFKKSFSGRNDRESNDGPREMFDATCSKCNKACKVPFKPTQGKPVLCSDCFKPRDTTGMTRSRSGLGGNRGGSFGGRNNKPFNRGRR